jgi:hypothetical protein
MNIKVIETWNGDNYTAIIRALVSENTEVRIRISGKRLIIKDSNVGFYKCIPKGDPVEIPIYDNCITEDEPVEPCETSCPCKAIAEMTEEQKQMYREWGLMT